MKDLKARVHSMSMDFPSRDAGSRGEELASESLADDFYALGLKTDIDGFECPGNLRISRSIYMALIVVAGLVCFLMPTMRIVGLILGVIGIVLSYLSYNGTDFLGSVVSKFESQNVIAKYVPEGMPTGTKRTKVVIVAHYDVKKPSIFQMPSVRKYWKIARLVVIGAAVAVPVCCILAMLPFLEVLSTFFGIVALIAAIIVLLEIVDQLLGSFLKTPKGSNCNASGLAVMLELAKKLVTSEVQSADDDDEGVIEEFGEDYSDLEDSEYADEASEAAFVDDGYEDEAFVSDGWSGSEADATVAPVDAAASDGAAQGGDAAQAEVAMAGAAAVGAAAAGVFAGAPNNANSGAYAAVDESAGMSEPYQPEQSRQADEQKSAPAADAKQVPANAANKAAVAAAETAGSVAAAAAASAPAAAAQVAVPVAAPAPAPAPAPMPAPRPRKASKPSWWSRVEDDKKHGEFEHVTNEPTLRSRYADAPASKEEPIYQEEQNVPSSVAAAPQSVQQPVQSIAQQAQRPALQPVAQPVQQPVAQPAEQQVAQTTPQSVQQPAVQPAQRPASQPAQQRASRPAPQQAQQPAQRAASAPAAPQKSLEINFDEQKGSSNLVADAMQDLEQDIKAANKAEEKQPQSMPAFVEQLSEAAKAAEADDVQGANAMPASEQNALHTDVETSPSVAAEAVSGSTEASKAETSAAPATNNAASAPDANSTVAYTPRPVSEVLDELDESIQAMGKKTIERKAMPERPEPYQEPLVEPSANSSAEWPSGSYKYSRNRAKYRKEETPKQSYDSLAQDPEVGVLDFSRERYQNQIEQKNQQAARSNDEAANAANAVDAVSDARVENATDAVDDISTSEQISEKLQTQSSEVATSEVSSDSASHKSHRKYDVNENEDNHATDDERSSLLNLPIVGSKNTAAASPSSSGLIDTNNSIASASWSAEQNPLTGNANETFIARDDVSDSSSLTGAFAPLGASGVMEPVTAEMLEQYNDGQTLYVEDAEDNYEEGYSEQGSYMNDIQIDMPKRKLFGRKKDKKRKNRKGKGYDSSANEWLGVDEGYNATQEGAKIGSWDNFSENPSDDYEYVDTGKSVWDSWDDYDDEDNDWRGGAYGGENYEQNRDAIQALSDELLNKEVWFVAVGSSDAGSAGMLNLLKTHEKDLKNARIINLECIGSGKLCFTSSEPILLQNYRVDPRMQKLIKKAAHTAKVDMERVKLDWRSTEATPAIAKRHRAITITALEDGVTPGWKWADDNDETVSNGNLKAALKVLVEIVKAC